ncbi:hypothetical protein BC834DRAFT_1030688 [Gloeopeniophorella convolvens]|nr:hypothetical protein BC834DRAFT_1030688 [Gloeopeniophorella convolvens]
MDMQWCLTCNRYLEGSDELYCSSECYKQDNPSTTPSSLFEYQDPAAISQAGPSLTSRWPGSDHEGILAWARDISPGLPSEERTPSPRRRQAAKPALLSTGMSPRPLAPALSVASSPVHAQPSNPIQTPRSSERAHPSLYHQSAGDFSTTTTSFVTDSVATPFSAPAPDPAALVDCRCICEACPHPGRAACPPPKRSAHDPAVAGVDPTPYALGRSRGTTSPLAVADEDLLPSRDADTRDDEFFAGWMGPPKKPTSQLPPPTPRDHPAFRTRGRKPTRAFVYC